MAAPRRRARPKTAEGLQSGRELTSSAVENTVTVSEQTARRSARSSAKPADAYNAAPPARSSRAQKIPKKDQGDVIFALDIGTRTVVGVLGIMDDEVLKIIDTESIPHMKRAMVDGQVEDIDQVAKIASRVKTTLEERNHIKLTEVSVAAAGRALKTYRVSMNFDVSEKSIITADAVKAMEIEAIMKAQASIDEKYKNDDALYYCVGHSVVRYMLDDYKMVSLEGHKGDKASIDLIAAFLPNIVVEGLYAVTDKVGLTIKSMTLEPIAAMSVIIPPEIRLINIALVDIGAGTSDIAVARDGAIVAYAMATIAGDEISEDIVRSYFVDFNMAEQMKKQASEHGEYITYRDIFGTEKKLKKSDFYAKCAPSVDNLADVICDAVCEANGESPAAMFLIGGGSMIKGLPEVISKRLEIDAGRVAVGGQEFLKNVDTCGRIYGPEYVTPIGIALSATSSNSYDFSSIKLNGETVRVFDTKTLSVFELLTTAGYKASQIMGHSGVGLKFFLNGETKLVKGTPFTPAQIMVNNAVAGLTTKIKHGDEVRMTPAVNGENAHVFIRDIVDPSELSRLSVVFCGENAIAGKRVYAGGKEVNASYEIQPLDNIETRDIRTLGAFLMQYEGDTEMAEVFVNGVVQPESYMLKNGDNITFTPAAERKGEQAEPAAQPVNVDVASTQETSDSLQEPEPEPELDYVQPEPEPYVPAPAPAPAAPAPKRADNGISVTFNGVPLVLPEKESKMPYMMIDLFGRANIDIENGTDKLIMTRNGQNANFTDKVNDGDIVIIAQDKAE